MDIEADIRNYLRDRGIHSVWIEGAIGYIRRALNGNRHFVTKVNSIRLDKHGRDMIGTLTLQVEAELPDAGKKVAGSIVYSFDQTRTKAHQVELKLA